MSIKSAVRIVAGTVIILSLTLALTVSQNWLYLTAFVGLNLFQSGFTGFCPAETIFSKMGLSHKE